MSQFLVLLSQLQFRLLGNISNGAKEVSHFHKLHLKKKCIFQIQITNILTKFIETAIAIYEKTAVTNFWVLNWENFTDKKLLKIAWWHEEF